MKRVSRTGGVYCGISGSSVSVAALEQFDELLELVDVGVDVALLVFEQLDAIETALERHLLLHPAAVADIVEIDHLLDLGETETDALAAQDPGEPGAIGVR